MLKEFDKTADFEDLIVKTLAVLSGSTVGLTTSQIVQQVFGATKVYPIILLTGLLGCLAAIGIVEFATAGRARVWKIKDTDKAKTLLKRDDIIYS